MDRTVARNIAYGIPGAAAAAYLVARAILVPLTYDEAATFQRYVDVGFTAVFDFNVATNHLLNTWLTWMSVQICGSAPWALRLPTLLGGFGFIVFAAAIARRAESTVVGLAGFVLLVANPYVLDYLALSRGYGLALGLLTASLYYLLEWFDRHPGTPEAWSPLARCVWLAAIAVLATFTVLPAFLALVAIVAGRHLWAARSTPPPAKVVVPMRRAWGFLAGWLLLAGAFSLMVFSRQEVLSASLFTPIVVRTAGLFELENDAIQAFRVDAKGRFRPLVRTGAAEWQSDAAQNAWAVRVELPVSVDRNLTSLEVTIGPRVFRRNRRQDGPWTTWDSGSRRVLRSTPDLSAPRSAIPTVTGAINWGGDAGQWRLAARHTAALIAGLATIAALLAGTASLAIRAGLIGYREARLLISAIVGVAGLMAAPIHLLRRDAQLYFGGTTGLVTDTFGSLLDKTAYGAVYTSHQLAGAFAGLALLVAALLATWAAVARHRGSLRGAFALLALIVLVTALVSAQHLLVGTPWLTGRTALFLIPLISTFIVVAADGMARIGPRAHAIVAPLLVLLAVAAAWNTVSAANVSRTLDWPDDGATPAMLNEVASRVDRTAPRTVRIGVQWMFYPAARYYAARMSDERTTYVVEVIPVEGPAPDFVYTAERPDPATATLIGGFTGSPAALWQID